MVKKVCGLVGTPIKINVTYFIIPFSMGKRRYNKMHDKEGIGMPTVLSIRLRADGAALAALIISYPGLVG